MQAIIDQWPDDYYLWLAARFQIASSGPEKLLLVAEHATHLFEQPIYADIVKAAAPGISWGALRQLLIARYTPVLISQAMERLIEAGVFRHEPPGQAREWEAFWESVGAQPQAQSLFWTDLSGFGSNTLARVLTGNRLSLSEDASLLLVTTDDYLRPELLGISRRTGPWILAKPVGDTIWLGPLFTPESPVCYECVAAALRAHRWQQASLSNSPGDVCIVPPAAGLPSTVALAAGMIATAVSVILARGGHPELTGAILTLDTRTLSQAKNILRPSPSCSHRCLSRVTPSEPDLESFISPISGVVSGLTVTATPEAGLHHARACFVHPPSVASPPQPPEFAYGSGATGQAAGNAAVAEALERYSSTWRGNERVIRARLSDLDAIPPERILLFSDSQYRNRYMWNALHGEMHSIPEPFEPSREIDWVLAEPLGSGAPKYLPAEFVYFSYPLHGPAWCQADSNGCAAGRSPSQATLRAVLECIERDALAIWWYNRLRRPAVALAAHGDPRLQPIVDAFAASSRRFWLLDITTDLHVPCYVAVSARPDGSELFFGAAADLCAHDAILRAASELSQVWFWSTHTQPHPELAAWLTTATLTTDPYFQPCGETAPGFTDRLPDGEALARCIARLQFAGIHPLCVDLTRPEIGLAVKRVVAPGLRHFWGRFAPGRLYDVPVRQGWLTHPLAEEALNPVPCML